MRFSSALAILAAICPAGAIADGHTDEHIGWRVFGIADISTNLYRGDNTSVSLLPIVFYDFGRTTVGLDGITHEVSQSAGSVTTAFLRPRYTDLVFTDAPELAGIDRDFSADLGFIYERELSDGLDMSFSLAQDITGVHDGQEIGLSATQRIDPMGLPLEVSLDLQWQSAELAGYLYGVGSAETAAGRPAYAPDAALIPTLSVFSGLPVDDATLLFGGVSYTPLPDQVTDSPITDVDAVWGLTIGIDRKF